MELRQLQTFRAVAEALSFSRAAEQLHIAQPAISRQVQALEEELGTRVFDRNRQRVLLTDAGRLLLARTEKILAEVEMATTAVRAVASGKGGELIVGSDWRLSFGLLQDTAAAFRRELPEAEISFRNLPLHEQVAALHARRIHLGFMPAEFISAGDHFETLTVLSSEIVVVMPSTHKFAGRRSVRLAELERATWLLPESPNHSYRSFLTQVCRLAGFSPICGKVESSMDGLLSMVAADYGVCLLPRIALPRQGRSLRFLHTDCAPLELCATWLHGNPSLLLQKYLALLRRHVGAEPPRKTRAKPAPRARAKAPRP